MIEDKGGGKMKIKGNELNKETIRKYDGFRVIVKGKGGFISGEERGYLYEKNGLAYLRKKRNSRYIYWLPQRDILEITIFEN